MRSIRLLVCALFITGLLAASLLGCGQLPTAPTSAPTTPATLTYSAQPQGLIGSLVDGLLGLLVRTLNLVGSLGGSLANGRWRVDVPAGAVEGNATVSLGVPNSTSGECGLEIWPADKNSFQKPVTLTVDCRSVSSDRLRTYVIHWYNPSTRQWVPVQGSRVDLTTKTVSAPLLHFSRYAVGPLGTKAGW
jgi:hypothetical protein